MGVTFATFRIKGTLPEVREKLNRSLRGKEKGLASSFNTQLLIASGPVALPNCRDFNMVSTSKGEVERKLRLYSGRVVSGGKVACVSSSSVCATKKLFTRVALSSSLV